MSFHSAIYRGTVFHQRLRPKRHRLRYQVFSLLLDLDELQSLDDRLALFSYNRRGPIAFYDRDHGPTDGKPLRPWVEDRLREAGLTPDGGPIRLLCYPRMFGYAFNPLSVYFCYRRAGGNEEELAAILYEVRNTFDERHTYIIPVSKGRKEVRQRCEKALYVSPFNDMDAHYDFRIAPPGDSIGIDIRHGDQEGPLLVATFHGRHAGLTNRSLAGCLAAFPLQTLKVTAAIHWHALLLWLKGMRPFTHTQAASPVESSVGHTIPEKV